VLSTDGRRETAQSSSGAGVQKIMQGRIVMTMVDDTPFVWRDLPECGLRIEHPQLRQPLTLIG